jgi:DNA-binding MarR family transcriptional regulator
MNNISLKNGTRPINGNGHAKAVNGRMVRDVGSDRLQLARELTDRVMAITRQLLAVEGQAAELPLGQLRICTALHIKPQTMSALGRELGVSLSAMTQIADRLERAGLVKRSSEDSDRRVRSLQLTPRGKKMMREREEIRIQRVSKVVQNLSPEARQEVLRALDVLLAAAKVES